MPTLTHKPGWGQEGRGGPDTATFLDLIGRQQIGAVASDSIIKLFQLPGCPSFRGKLVQAALSVIPEAVADCTLC